MTWESEVKPPKMPLAQEIAILYFFGVMIAIVVSFHDPLVTTWNLFVLYFGASTLQRNA